MIDYDYKAQAINELRPGAKWSMSDGVLTWMDDTQTEPTEAEIDAEIVKIKAQEPFNACKQQASELLYETDWTTIADVANPANTPYLTNQADFIAWRSQVRALAVNPVADPVFPPKPNEIWG
jgi:hypothetical protein